MWVGNKSVSILGAYTLVGSMEGSSGFTPHLEASLETYMMMRRRAVNQKQKVVDGIAD